MINKCSVFPRFPQLFIRNSTSERSARLRDNLPLTFNRSVQLEETKIERYVVTCRRGDNRRREHDVILVKTLIYPNARVDSLNSTIISRCTIVYNFLWFHGSPE